LSWNKSDLDRVVDDIFKVDWRIRAVTFLDGDLKIIVSKMRPKVKSLSPREFDREYDTIFPPLALGALQHAKQYFGKLQAVVAMYDRLLAAFYETKDFRVLVYFDPEAKAQVLEILSSVRKLTK
jgi:hypothetical protein